MMSVEPYKYQQLSFPFEFAKTLIFSSTCTVLFRTVVDTLNNTPNEFGDIIVESLRTRNISALTDIGFLSTMSWIIFPNPTKHSLLAMLAYTTLSCVAFSIPTTQSNLSSGAAQRIGLCTLSMLAISKILGISYANAIPLNGLVYILVNSLRSAIPLFDRTYSHGQCYTWLFTFGVTFAGLCLPTFNFSNSELPSTISVVTTAAAISGLVHFISDDLKILHTSIWPEEIKQWHRDHYEVSVYRTGSDLQYRSFNTHSNNTTVENFKLNRRSLDNTIDLLRRADVCLDPDGSASFTSYKIPDSLESKMARLWDNNLKIQITKDNWTVSLCSTSNTWHGHARIIIEGFELGKRVIYNAHLTGDSNLCTYKGAVKAISENYGSGVAANVQLTHIPLNIEQPITQLNINKIARVWEIKREMAKRMLDDITSEINFQKGGQPAVFFTYEGSSSVISSLKKIWSAYRQKYVIPHNCLSWAKEKLEIANINFDLSGLSNFFAVPNYEL